MADEGRRKLPPGGYIALGGEQPDVKQASFRLMGDALDPDVITRTTGLTPQVAHRKGDPRPMTDYRRREELPAPPPWRTGIWMLHSEVDLARTEHRLQDHIGVLLEKIKPVVVCRAERPGGLLLRLPHAPVEQQHRVKR